MIGQILHIHEWVLFTLWTLFLIVSFRLFRNLSATLLTIWIADNRSWRAQSHTFLYQFMQTGYFAGRRPNCTPCLNRTAWIGRRKWPLKRSNAVSRCGVCHLRKNIPYQVQGRRWDQTRLFPPQRPAGAFPPVLRVHEALSIDSGNARETKVCSRHVTRAGRVYVEMLTPWIRKEGLSCSILPDMGS